MAVSPITLLPHYPSSHLVHTSPNVSKVNHKITSAHTPFPPTYGLSASL
jgi:hypothetical protein